MGMAASQARFLGITARKTNTEYEGQQVNQQRTALANQSANLFNQMLALEVPSPPSKSDSKFTKTEYAFIDDSGQKATVQSIVNNTDPSTSAAWPKIVKYITSENQNVSYRNNLTNTGAITTTRANDGTLLHLMRVGTSTATLERLDLNYTDETYKKDMEAKSAISKYDDGTVKGTTAHLYKFGDGNYIDLPTSITATDAASSADFNVFKINDAKEAELNASKAKIYKDGDKTIIELDGTKYTVTTNREEDDGSVPAGEAISIDDVNNEVVDTDRTIIADIKKAYTDFEAADGIYYKYVINNQAYYVPSQQTEGNWDDDETGSPLVLSKTTTPYGYYLTNSMVDVEKEMKAAVTYDSSGRLQSILLDNGSTQQYSITVNSVTDEDKYEDAMNQYKYDMAKYEKEIEDINKKTEAIQVQDRTLELRLKQLDTEQEALTQEMDAIKKVIDKNVETTFKTFA